MTCLSERASSLPECQPPHRPDHRRLPVERTMNWSGGLPFTVAYSSFGTDSAGNAEDCNTTRAVQRPVLAERQRHMKTNLSSPTYNADPNNPKVAPSPDRSGHRKHPAAVPSPSRPRRYRKCGSEHLPRTRVLRLRLGLTKAFTIHEQIAAKFRMDAYNAFNHIQAANPCSTTVQGLAHQQQLRAQYPAWPRVASLVNSNSPSASSSNFAKGNNQTTRGASAPLFLCLGSPGRTRPGITASQVSSMQRTFLPHF